MTGDRRIEHRGRPEQCGSKTRVDEDENDEPSRMRYPMSAHD
jgi:hypothetical protein